MLVTAKMNVALSRCAGGIRAGLPVLAAAVLIVAMAASGSSALEEVTPIARGEKKVLPGERDFLGGWVGSRLQCKKDESGPVRCGTPSAFRVEFRPDGTGSAQGENFPAEFTHEVSAEGKVVVASRDGKGRKLELFDLKVESDFITFQAYVYPEKATEEGEEYVHYVFDLAREEVPPANP